LAGYDFFVRFREELRPELTQWIRHLNGVAWRYELSLGGEDYPKTHGKVRVLVNVDGPLSGLQAFASQLPLRADLYCRSKPELTPEAIRAIRSSVRDSSKGMEAITSIVYSTTRKFRQIGAKVKFRTLALPPAVLNASRSRRHPRRERDAVRSVVACVRRWTTGKLTAKEVLILVDQAVEDWLRSRLPQVKASVNFPELTRQAVAQKVLSRAEATRLRRFHSSRTHSQHRGRVASNKTATSNLGFLLVLFEAKYVDASSPWERITPEALRAELSRMTRVDSSNPPAELKKHLDDQDAEPRSGPP
jgi:hypothetical protein